MTNTIPAKYHDLLTTRAFANLATIMDDGAPQVTPVWFDLEGDLDGNLGGYYVRVNSAQGRVKDRNMRARPYVALSIVDPHNPYRYLQIRGPVVEITTEGADAHIDALAEKYTGAGRRFNHQPGEVRVIYKIKPEHVHASG